MKLVSGKKKKAPQKQNKTKKPPKKTKNETKQKQRS